MTTNTLWQALDHLVLHNTLLIDRPRGTIHPRFPDFTYPLDYGYLQGTQAVDDSGIDVWVGSLPGTHITALLVTVDLQKQDVEIKLLLGCTPEECHTVLELHDQWSWGGQQSAILIQRDSR